MSVSNRSYLDAILPDVRRRLAERKSPGDAD